MFRKGHQVRPPVQEPSASWFSCDDFLSASRSWEGEMQDGFRLCFQRGQQRHWLKPGLSILIECATWMLPAGREDVAVGWLVCCALGAHRVEKKPLCEGTSPLVILAWARSQRLAAVLTLRWGGDRSQATSDNWTAAVTLGAVFLLFLGVENGEDCFIKHGFETFLSQGRAFQVALCTDLKYKKKRKAWEKKRRKAQWSQPSAQPSDAAACPMNSLGVV